MRSTRWMRPAPRSILDSPSSACYPARALINRSLDALAKLCLRHSKSIAIVALVAGIGAIAAATRLTFDPDLLNLIPQNNKQVNDFKRVLRDMGTIDNHIIV